MSIEGLQTSMRAKECIHIKDYKSSTKKQQQIVLAGIARIDSLLHHLARGKDVKIPKSPTV